MRWALKDSALMLGLDQGHALKAFRASNGDEDGHSFNFSNSV